MKTLLTIILMVLATYSISAQFDQDVEFIQITMKDGTVKKGIFVEMNKSEITYIANGQNYTVARSQIETFALGKSSVTVGEKDILRKNYPEN